MGGTPGRRQDRRDRPHGGGSTSTRSSISTSPPRWPSLDPSLDEAAQNLGASRFRRFWRVTFPLILPGVFAGATIVFIWSFTELGTPLMFDFYQVTPVQIFLGHSGGRRTPPNPRHLRGLVVVIARGVAGDVRRGEARPSGGRGYATTGKATVGARPARRLHGPGCRRRVSRHLPGDHTAVAVLPHIGVRALIALRRWQGWYQAPFFPRPGRSTITRQAAALASARHRLDPQQPHLRLRRHGAGDGRGPGDLLPDRARPRVHAGACSLCSTRWRCSRWRSPAW